jgi:hypothetical protein
MCCLVTVSKHVNNIWAIARQPPVTIIKGLWNRCFLLGLPWGYIARPPGRLRAVQLSEVELSWVELSWVELSWVELSGVEWSGVEWSGVEWSGVKWSEVKWSEVNQLVGESESSVELTVDKDFSWKSACEEKTMRLVWNGRQPGTQLAEVDSWVKLSRKAEKRWHYSWVDKWQEFRCGVLTSGRWHHHGRWRISIARSRYQETASGDCNRLKTLVCVYQWSVKCSYKWCI